MPRLAFYFFLRSTILTETSFHPLFRIGWYGCRREVGEAWREYSAWIPTLMRLRGIFHKIWFLLSELFCGWKMFFFAYVRKILQTDFFYCRLLFAGHLILFLFGYLKCFNLSLFLYKCSLIFQFLFIAYAIFMYYFLIYEWWFSVY